MGLTKEQSGWVANLKAEMEKNVNGGGFSKEYVTYWAGIMEDGSTYHSTNQACHVGLGYDGWSRKVELNGKKYTVPHPIIILSRIQYENNPLREHIPDEIYDAYFKWVTTYSPFSEAFLKKGGPAVRKYGYVCVKTQGIPANLMSGALLAARMATEHGGSIMIAWYYLVKEGLDPHIAYAHAHQVTVTWDDTNKKWAVVVYPKYGHTGWYGNKFSKGMVVNFLNRKMPNALAEWGSGRGDYKYSYSPIAEAWGNAVGSYKNNEAKKIWDETKNDIKISNNIFKAQSQADVKHLEPFVKAWAEFLKDDYKDVKKGQKVV